MLVSCIVYEFFDVRQIFLGRERATLVLSGWTPEVVAGATSVVGHIHPVTLIRIELGVVIQIVTLG